MSALTVHDLSVDIGARPILSDIAFEARAGEVVGLIGPNGAGKTTLLRALCRLIPARTGTVVWDGHPVDRMDARARALTLAYLPQGQTVHWPLSARRLVELGRLPRLGSLGRPAPADAAAVETAMTQADVAHLADRNVLNLSGGERARVLLARALAVEAPVLLADEPTASLDPYHVLRIMGLLRRSADQGRLVIAVMHELGVVTRFCDRVVLLNDGRKVAEGAPKAVLTPERLREVYRIDPANFAGLSPA
ncbi:MAG TPA: ABC transporter ATP-binding protein [Caulobacteraceae bacterium]|jgi:iron complex transport system ATP-binding protein|nr:ABC transporter ATP-binding protein [Caulobacteraceae bacterium]